MSTHSLPRSGYNIALMARAAYALFALAAISQILNFNCSVVLDSDRDTLPALMGRYDDSYEPSCTDVGSVPVASCRGPDTLVAPVEATMTAEPAPLRARLHQPP